MKTFVKYTVCSDKCQDPGTNFERNINCGFPALNGVLKLVIGNLIEKQRLLSNQTFEKVAR